MREIVSQRICLNLDKEDSPRHKLVVFRIHRIDGFSINKGPNVMSHPVPWFSNGLNFESQATPYLAL
jgi:hypothetical protein